VLVDYAHSDDALANVLRALRPTVPDGGRLRVVFGCGGDRDRSKRPRMARVACEGADEVIVTSDNPRTEDPGAIIAEILAGVPEDARARVAVESDRAQAISRAVASAREGDIILIAGKGHEDYQIVGTEKRSFDDRREAEAALRLRSGG
jgi:UDP-N-acetylmuramoyl-L-alanyl-D-glutamate--2,6-diaminopimelate ligase